MKTTIIFTLSIILVVVLFIKANAQTISVIDNSDFSETPSKPLPVVYVVQSVISNLQNLKSRDDAWTQQIAQDQIQINQYQNIIDTGAEAGVGGALPYASPTALNAIASNAQQSNAVNGMVAP